MNTLKVKLLVWRMLAYFKPLSTTAEAEVDSKFNNRVKEVWKSKILTAEGTPAYQTMMDMAEEFRKQKAKKLGNSLEAYVVKTVLSLGIYYGWREIQFDTIWKTLLRFLDVTDIVAYEEASVDVDLIGYTITKKKIGGIMYGVLHGERFNRKNFGRTWKFDKEMIAKLAQKYSVKAEEKAKLESILLGLKTVNDANDVNDKKSELLT
jgi:hypothetical protein